MKDDRVKIIVGLGNPGLKYKNTRHNVGFMALDVFAKRCGGAVKTKKTADFIRSTVVFDHEELILIKPQAYMNNSGHSLAATGINWAGLHKNVLVVYDDVTLDFGRLRVRGAGSAGGHKGMKNIIDVLSTQEIPRLRIGVGKDPEMEMVDYVLKPFFKEEKKYLPDVLNRAADAIECAVADGVEAAMNKYNASAGSAE